MRIRLFSDGVLYRYSISFCKNGIAEESLYYKPNGRTRLVFARGTDREVLDGSISSRTTSSSAYLTVAASFNDAIATKVLKEISGINVLMSGDTVYLKDTYQLSMRDDKLKRMVLRAFDAADLGIVDFRTVDGEGTDIVFRHEMNGIDAQEMDFPSSMESKGTNRMFSLIGPVAKALRDGGTVLIDGFGSDLHPFLTRWVVSLFNSSENSSGAQLIVNTHDLSLMDIRDVFRRDQIWFTNKDRGSGASVLYPLSYFKGVRKNSDILHDYIAGRFDAIPYIISYDTL